MSFNEEEDRLNKVADMFSRTVNFANANGKFSSIPLTDVTYDDSSSIDPRIEKWKDASTVGKESGIRRKEDATMDDNKLLEKYMDKIDRDQRELRDDMKKRESRIEDEIANSEARENERMNRIEQLIKSQSDKVDALKDEVANKLVDDKKYRHANNIAIALGVIATALTMVGIYYATVSMITDIIGVAVK